MHVTHHMAIAVALTTALSCTEGHTESPPHSAHDAGDARVASDAGDAGEDAAAAEYMCASDDVVEGTCKAAASGVFAVKIELDAWWQAPLLNPGRGKVVTYLRGTLTDLCEDGSSARVALRMCGIDMPVFRSKVACSSFKLDFSHVDWNGPSMPTFSTIGRTTGFEPGEVLTTSPATGLIGIDLDNLTGPWPTNTRPPTCQSGQSGVACFPDHDADGRPGITARTVRLGELDTTAGDCEPGVAYRFTGLPTDASASALQPDSPRVETLALGLRTRINVAGTISNDCSRGVGDAMAGTLDSFAIDCWMGDGTQCLPTQTSFIQESSPQWYVLQKGEVPPDMDGIVDRTPSIGARALLVRLGDGDQVFDCADVRAATLDQP